MPMPSWDVAKLKQCRLFIATPMYGGQCHGRYVQSCLGLLALCGQYGIDVRFFYVFNDSLIAKARNNLADQFMQESSASLTPSTHLLFIDGDIAFDPADVLTLLSLDKDVIGVPYSRKVVNWDAIKTAIRLQPDISDDALRSVSGDCVFNTLPDTNHTAAHNLVEVQEAGTGLMMIKRQVFERMAAAFPTSKYRSESNADDHRYTHAFFDTAIMEGRYFSEDYYFCRKWREIGGQVFICPGMVTRHIGAFEFEGNLPAIANLRSRAVELPATERSME
jgi:hypothetical protein